MENKLELINTCLKVEQQLISIKEKLLLGKLSGEDACNLLSGNAELIGSLQTHFPKWAESMSKFVKNIASLLQQAAITQKHNEQTAKRPCGFRLEKADQSEQTKE